MAPRDPSRPKASHLSDVEVLMACEAYTRVGAPHPIDPFLARVPQKVVAAKLAKLERRGLIDRDRRTTKAGLAFIAEHG